MLRLLYQFPSWMQRLYRGVTWRRRDTGVAASGQKTVYLTFDDGSIPEVTPAILDVLAKYGVKATFFVVGDNIRKYPHVYARVVEEGHRVGNHTYHHVKGTKCSLVEYLQEVDACEEAISSQKHPTAQACGEPAQSAVRLFRPPYGKMTFDQKRAVLERGYEIVLWDVLTHDYNCNYSPEKMLCIVQRYTRDGSIINFHDSIKSGERTITVLPQVIEWLQQQGYRIATL